MRLDRLDLTRYGRFTDRSLSFEPPAPGEPDLHVLYGPNEAGKSTLFSAWLDFLFGIPIRTRYDFRHAGPSLQIGAALSHAGGALDLKRLKRNAGSLLDRYDAPVPEAVLQGALGGLSREGYSAMFSLDDETLEQGGDSILASRGDLGEMLFSASAGLSGLAPQLEGLRAGLDDFHRSGKRSGGLVEAKRALTELERQRRAVEVSANALQKLAREAEAAEQAWQAARGQADAAQAALDRLQQVAQTLPLLARRARLAAQLEPLAALPEATADDEALAAKIEAEQRDISARIADRAERCRGLKDQRDALPQDAAVLAQAAAIEAAEALRAEHDAALKDLPRREDEAAEAQARIRGLLAQLGQPGAEPGNLCLPEAALSTLRGLLARRSGLQGAVQTSAAETARAQALLDSERAETDDPGPAEDEAALAALLTRLRAQDPTEALTRAERACAEARGRADESLVALAPWRGTGAALAAQDVPGARHLDEWGRSAEAARQARADARRDLAALAAQRDRMDAEAATRTAGQGGLTLADAAKARSRREALWAAHRGDLTAASADQFEAALREDDRISAALADSLAEGRRAAQHQAERAALVGRQQAAEAALAEAEAALADAEGAVERAASALGLPGADLAALRLFLDRREQALAALRVLQAAEADVTRATEARRAAAQALAGMLGRSAEESFEALLARAIARTDAAERRREARRRLATLTADLRARQQAEAEAQAALDAWRAEWTKASRDTLLAARGEDDAGLGTLLDLLDRLGAEHRAAEALGDRIAKMQANRQRFQTAKAAVLTALAEEAGMPWTAVQHRLRQAQDAARDRDLLDRQLAREQRQDGVDRHALSVRDAEAERLGAALGWTPAEGPLAAHVARCRTATGLRQDLAALEAELQDRPLPQEGEDDHSVKAAIQDLRAELDVLRHDTEARLKEHLEARGRLDAVGGDDALARIVAERETLLLDLRERAEAHLARRFGLIAFEAGLRRYRDHHRSGMLARASDAFSALSCGAYQGLAAQPDGKSEVLVALPAGGGAKLAADLSKGTRFQLYLALRIAGYHEMAQSRPTVPFIADDIMETFDDARSAAAFGLLAEMSRVGQVIYLTHHRHLCDIAREVCPGVKVTDLSAPS
ncbi:AAA family ATPase [Pararhodobacter aggregans]